MTNTKTCFLNVLENLSRWQFILIIALICIPLFYFVFNPQPSILDDNFHYMNLARQLSSGKGYTNPYSVEPIPETHVAPGYPFVLSLIIRITGHDKPIVAFKLFNNFCFWLALVLIAFIFDKHLKLNRWVTLIFSLFLLFNSEIAMFASMVSTEAPFLCFSALTIVFFLEYSIERKLRYFILAILATVAALYIRIPGAPLAVVCFIWLIWRKEYKKAALYALAVGSLVGIWILPLLLKGQFLYTQQIARAGLDTSKIGHYDSFVTRYFHHFLSYFMKFIPSLFIPRHIKFLYTGSEVSIFSWLGLILGIPILVFSIIGVVRTFKDNNNLVTFYAALYFMIYSVFASHGTRYASYAFPFLFYLIAVGLWSFLGWLKLGKKARTTFVIIPLMFLFLFEGLPRYYGDVQLTSKTRNLYKANGNSYAELSRLHRYQREESIFRMHKALRWCKSNIPKDKIILGSQIRSATFITDHRVVSPTYLKKYFTAGYKGFIADKSITEIDSLGKWMLDNRVEYVVLDKVYNITTFFIRPLMSRYQDCFDQAYSTEAPTTSIFSVDTSCLRASITKGNEDFIKYFIDLYKAKLIGNKYLLDSLLNENDDTLDQIKKIIITHSYLMDIQLMEKADMFFEGACIKYPHDPAIWMARGIDLNQNDKNELSIISLEKARIFGAKEAECYNNMAIAYANMGDLENSLRCFKLAAKKDPFDPVIFENIIFVYIRLGDAKSAEAFIVEQLARTDVDSLFTKRMEKAKGNFYDWKIRKNSKGSRE
ncbi:glycosyltransferase family 39 protein [bacterium]|nr:glycosyltransferase family 39 protein [bacterium]